MANITHGGGGGPSGDDLAALIRKLSETVQADRIAIFEAAKHSAEARKEYDSQASKRGVVTSAGSGTSRVAEEEEEDDDDDVDGEEEEDYELGEGDQGEGSAGFAGRFGLASSHGGHASEESIAGTPQRASVALAPVAHPVVGPSTIFKQLQAAVSEMEAAAQEGRQAIRSPVTSPPRKVSFFGRQKGEKRRAITKLRAQLEVADGDRRSLAERLARLGRSTSAALGMLQDQWAQAQAELEDRGRELDNAYELVTKQEEEANALREEIAQLKLKLVQLQASPSPCTPIPTPSSTAAPVMEQRQVPAPVTQGVAEEGPGAGLDVKSKEVERLQLQLDMAHGKLEALQMQQQMQQDRHAALVTRYEKQLREADSKAADTQDQLAAMAAKYASLKNKAEQLDDALEKVSGQNEAMKHQMQLRDAKMEVQLREAQKVAREMETRVKNELFENMKIREELDKVRGEYEILLGQLEALRSQVELEKLEMVGLVEQHDHELNEMYGRLDAEAQYAGMLTDVRQELDQEMVELRERLEVAEKGQQQAESSLTMLATRYKVAAARRLALFVKGQDHRLQREAFHFLKRLAQNGKVK